MYVSLDENGRICASTSKEEYAEGMTEFEFPDDFDFSQQDSYRIVDKELIFDPVPISDAQKEVADLLGISQSYISRLEKKIIRRLKKEMVRYENC